MGAWAEGRALASKIRFGVMFGTSTEIGTMPDRLAALEKRVDQLQAELEKMKADRATSS